MTEPVLDPTLVNDAGGPTPVGMSRILDYGIALGIVDRPEPDRLLMLVKAWHDICWQVPVPYILDTMRGWTSAYRIRPSQVRGGWIESKRAAPPVILSRACGLSRLCSCDHAEGHCYAGWLEPGDNWCEECWDARNLRRDELGLEPVPVGTIGKNV